MRNNKRRLQLQCTFSSRKVRQDFRYFHVHLNSISLNIHTNISSLFHRHPIRLFQTLTDVTLKVKDDEFKTHKVVLAAASPVFEAMFKEGTDWCSLRNTKTTTSTSKTLNVTSSRCFSVSFTQAK